MNPDVDLFSLPEESARRRLLEIMKRVTFRYSEQEEFSLASGRRSRYYFDCKPTFSHAEARALIGRLIWERFGTVTADAVGGMAVGAIPIANAVSDAAFRKGTSLRSFFVRKSAKEHGTKKTVEGDVKPGERALIVEDVITTGQSTVEAIIAAREFGLQIVKVIALIDREEADGRRNIENLGVPCDALFTVKDFGV